MSSPHSNLLPEQRPRRSIAWKVMVGILSSYFSVAVVASVFQERLIYKPIQKARIEPADSRLDRMVVSTVRVPTHDGLVLNGWRATPLSTTPRCSVLFFHGNFGNRTWYWRTLQMFQDLNVEVWLIDYRGYGDNAGSPNEADFWEDAHSTWAVLTEDYGIAADQIVICGYSLGGAVAVGLAASLCESGTIPCGLVTVATFPSLADTAAQRLPLLPVRLLLREKWPSAEQVKQVSCPILHIHGAGDRIIP